MKKILSLILACVICITAIPVSAFAETQTTDNISFGVITDAEGNVVEVLTMPRATYVNQIITVPAGGHFTSYQYEPNNNFLFGYDTKDYDGNYITDPYCKIEVKVEMSHTIGADDKIEHATRSRTTGGIGDIGGGMSIAYHADEYYKYCNGVLTNKSSIPTRVRIIVLLNYTDQEYYEIVNNL